MESWKRKKDFKNMKRSDEKVNITLRKWKTRESNEHRNHKIIKNNLGISSNCEITTKGRNWVITVEKIENNERAVKVIIKNIKKSENLSFNYYFFFET